MTYGMESVSFSTRAGTTIVVKNTRNVPTASLPGKRRAQHCCLMEHQGAAELTHLPAASPQSSSSCDTPIIVIIITSVATAPTSNSSSSRGSLVPGAVPVLPRDRARLAAIPLLLLLLLLSHEGRLVSGTAGAAAAGAAVGRAGYNGMLLAC